MGKIGFVGVGNMGKALVEGVLQREGISPENIVIYDVIRTKAEELRQSHHVEISESIEDLLTKASIIMIAVKPQNMEEVLRVINKSLVGKPLIISIAAGIDINFMESRLPEGVPIIRAMPNTPALVSRGAAVLARNSFVTDEAMREALQLFQSVGVAFEAEEKLMDAVTGLSGSGPAYFLLFLEALTDAGVMVGLGRDLAKELVLQTALGTIELVKRKNLHFAQLKDMVTSPGGTTIHALKIMERGGLRGLIMEAVGRATERSRELKK